jgi:hypothetical protein
MSSIGMNRSGIKMERRLYFPLLITLLVALVFGAIPLSQPSPVYAAPDTENLWSGSNSVSTAQLTLTNSANANGSGTGTWAHANGQWAKSPYEWWEFVMGNSAVGTGTINSVNLYLKHYQSGWQNDNFLIQIYDGSAWNDVQSYTSGSGPPTSGTLNNWNVSATIDTWTKIDAAKVRIIGNGKSAAEDTVDWYVDTVELRIDYTPASNSPSITSVSLTETAMTPQTQYSVTVVVSDADNLSDLTTVVLKVWYDSDAGNPLESEYNSASAHTQTCAIITYTLSGTFVIDPTGAGTSWVLGSCTPFTAGEKAATTGDCVFVFTPGKVATETTGSANWQVAAKATDSASQTGYGYDTTPGATMSWYGEITVTPAAVDFGTLAAGTDFGATSIQNISEVIYISNGSYDEQMKSNACWGGSSSFDATGACSNDMEFALKADNTATLGTAVLVNTTGVAIDDTGTITGEGGDNVTTNNLWLKLSGTFTTGTYSNGTITYLIVNGS